jgi:hypothetical protein
LALSLPTVLQNSPIRDHEGSGADDDLTLPRRNGLLCHRRSAGHAEDQAAALPSISPTQEKEIRDFVQGENQTSVAIPSTFKLAPGATLPDGVNLYAFDSDMSAAQFRYTLIGGKIVVADPASRKVIWILE